MRKLAFAAAFTLALAGVLALCLPTRAIAQGVLSYVVGLTGGTAPTSGLLMGGSDGTNLRAVKTAADGSVATVHVASGTGYDSSGREIVVGAAATGAAVSGSPVYVGGKDGSGNAQPIALDTSGREIAVGAAAVGGAAVGNPVYTAGLDGSNQVRPIPVASNSATAPLFSMPVAGLSSNDGATSIPLPLGINGSTIAGFSTTPAVQIAGIGFNQTSLPPRYCDKSITFTTLSTTARVQQIAAVANQHIYICGWQLFGSTATTGVDLTWTEGTGSNCATGTATIGGKFFTTPTAAPANSPNSTWGPSAPAQRWTITAGDAVCITQSATTNATTLAGTIFFTQN